MMEEEKRQLVAIDLCARLRYGLKVKCEKYPFPVTVLYAGDVDEVKFEETGGIEHICAIKPYLRPVSSMTEEEIKEFSAFGFEVVNHINANRDECPKYQVIEVSNFSEITKVTDWLNKKMFDYRGLIPIGLALEALEGMYSV